MVDITLSAHGACRLLQKILALSLSLETLHLYAFPMKAFEALSAINENIRDLNICLPGDVIRDLPTTRVHGIKKLCQFISENKSLQQLTLCEVLLHGVLYKELSAISQSMQQNHTLRKVTLVTLVTEYQIDDGLSLDPRITVRGII